jgi:hypothetical protein
MSKPVHLSIRGHRFDVSNVPVELLGEFERHATDYLAEHAAPTADDARSACWFAYHRSGAAVRISRD